MLKFFSALALLLTAIVAEIFLASGGIYLNLALAALIAFAFVFDLAELSVFALFSVFILSWQPAPSLTIIAFALIPFVVYAFRKLARIELWTGNLIAIGFGFLMFYLAAAPAQFLGTLPSFFIDLLAGLIMGEMTLLLLV